MLRKVLRWLLGVVVTVVVAVTVWIFVSVNSAGRATGATKLSIPKGQGIRSVAGQLYRAGLIPSRQAWTLFAAITGQYRAVLPGNYRVEAGASGREILQLLAAGPNDDREVTVTVPEGLRLDEVAQLLNQKGAVSAEAFLQLAKRPGDLIQSWPTDLFKSKPPSVDLEGYVFPDTYRFFRDSTAEVVVRRMVENTDQRLSSEIRSLVAVSGHSLHEILTMASILELELKTPSDRAMAADLFWRRIAAGIPMQSDATVNYVTGKSRAQPSIDDTKANSPFNTYQVKGLPPGPIGNPGLVSIQAALKPTPNDYFYYLTAPGGQTIWSKTYEEHLANKRKYLSGS